MLSFNCESLLYIRIGSQLPLFVVCFSAVSAVMLTRAKCIRLLPYYPSPIMTIIIVPDPTNTVINWFNLNLIFWMEKFLTSKLQTHQWGLNLQPHLPSRYYGRRKWHQGYILVGASPLYVQYFDCFFFKPLLGSFLSIFYLN